MFNRERLQEIARQAIQLLGATVYPWIVHQVSDKKRGCHCVVLVPGNLIVLYETMMGISDGRHDYRSIAISKAKQARLAQGPNQMLPACFLQPGDTRFHGSCYYRGVAVGVSGLEPECDELVASLIAVTFIGLCERERMKWQRRNPDREFFD